MKKTKIGIPRALLYYRYGVLWKTFFEKLNCKIIISPETNRSIISLGSNNTIDECCLSYKIYIGHVLYLKDRCDYILVPRICDYGPLNKVCTRLNGTYDTVRYILSKQEIITYTIDHAKFKYEFFEFIKMGLKVNKNIIRIIYSYIIAKRKQKHYDQIKENEQKNKLNKAGKKILIISHIYNIQDKYLSNFITSYLEKHNITILYANNLNKKVVASFADYFSDTLYWKYSKELIGAIYYYRYQIDGLIFVSTYPCSQDGLVNNLAIIKNKQLPILNLIIDDNITDISLETKLESFIDIIKGEYNEK